MIELYVSYTQTTGGKLDGESRRNPFRLRVNATDSTREEKTPKEFQTIDTLCRFLVGVPVKGRYGPYLGRNANLSEVQVIPVGTEYFIDGGEICTELKTLEEWAGNYTDKRKVDVINRIVNNIYTLNLSQDEIITTVQRFVNEFGLDKAEIWSLVAEHRLDDAHVPQERWKTIRTAIGAGIREYCRGMQVQPIYGSGSSPSRAEWEDNRWRRR